MENASLEPRRKPSQERSRQRVEVILDAVSEILVKKGFSALTTTAIAAEAGVPIGSLYQFFPNKFAIFQAVVEQFFRKMDTVFERDARSDDAALSWEERSDRTIEALARLWSGERAFAILWRGIQNMPEMRAAASEQFRKVEDHHVALLKRFRRNLDPFRRRIIARVMARLGEELLSLSLRGSPEENQQVVHELKVLMKAYIRTFMSEEEAAAGLGRR